jgi:hypothetical protein
MRSVETIETLAVKIKKTNSDGNEKAFIRNF